MHRWIGLLCACTLIIAGCGEERVSTPTAGTKSRITLVAPAAARTGDRVKIQGVELGKSGTVQVDGGKVLATESWSSNSVVIILPPELAPGDHTLSVLTGGHAVGPATLKVLPPIPELMSIEPSAGHVGDTVVLSGRFLGKGPPDVRLFFYGAAIDTTISWSETAIKFKVPHPGEASTVWVESNGVASNEMDFHLVRPNIKDVVPEATVSGGTLELIGTGFGGVRGEVLFGIKEKSPIKVLSWSDTRIAVQLPPTEADEAILMVKTDSGRSLPTSVTLLKPPPGGQIGATPLQGENLRLVLDGFDFPHVVFYNEALTTPFYWRWTGSEWKGEEIPVPRDSHRFMNVEATPGLKGFRPAVGKYPSLCLDGAGRVHMTCHDVFNQKIIDGVREPAGAWKFAVVDPTGPSAAYFSSVAVDRAGNAYVAYGDQSPGALHFGKWTAGSIVTKVIDPGPDVGFTVALALDSHGEPHVAHLDVDNFRLRYTYKEYNDFHSEEVESTKWAGDAPSLVCDASGVPNVAYTVRDDSGTVAMEIHFARREGRHWTIETVDKGPGVGAQPNMEIDGDGRVHVVYAAMSQGEIRHAVRRQDGTWKIYKTPIDKLVMSLDQGALRMALGKDGRPRVVYFAGVNKALQFRILDAR